MMEIGCDSQWQTGLQPGCGQARRINIAQIGVATAKVPTIDKIEIVTMIMSMEKIMGIDMIALE